MITNLIDKQAKKYDVIKEKILSIVKLKCECENPGYKIECKDCPFFVEIVKQIQQEMYPDDYRHGTQFNCGHRYNSKVNRKSYSEETKQECIKLYQKLQSTVEVGRLTGISNGTICRWLLQAGLKLTGTHKDYTLEEKLKCVELYKELGTYRGVSKQTGYEYTTIKRWVRQAEKGTLAEENKRKHKPEKKEQAIKLYQEGMNRIEVCIEVRISKETFNRWLLEYKIPLRPLDSSVSRPRYSEEVKQKCLNIYEKTKSYQAVSVETGIHPETVKLWVKKSQKNV